MRRFLAIVIVALFWLVPFAALLPGSAESQLPACCRRHGAHHCAMMSMGASDSATPGHSFAAPNHCPRYAVSPLPILQKFLAARQTTASFRLNGLIDTRVEPLARSSASKNLSVRGPPASC